MSGRSELEIVRIPIRWTLMSNLKRPPQKILKLPLWRIRGSVRLNSWWLRKPQLENLAAAHWVCREAGTDDHRRALLQRKTPICYKLADLLPDFDICRLSRLSIIVACINGRRIKWWTIKNVNFSVDLCLICRMTRLGSSKEIIYCRMKDFPMVLNEPVATWF